MGSAKPIRAHRPGECSRHMGSSLNYGSFLGSFL